MNTAPQHPQPPSSLFTMTFLLSVYVTNQVAIVSCNLRDTGSVCVCMCVGEMPVHQQASGTCLHEFMFALFGPPGFKCSQPETLNVWAALSNTALTK